MLRLMEVLLHRATQLGGGRSRQIPQAILSAFPLTPKAMPSARSVTTSASSKPMPSFSDTATVTPTDKGIRVALMFILFHHGVCGPLANSLFLRQPTQLHTPTSRLQAAYHQADASIQHLIDLIRRLKL